jgi:hypothetical protein
MGSLSHTHNQIKYRWLTSAINDARASEKAGTSSLMNAYLYIMFFFSKKPPAMYKTNHSKVYLERRVFMRQLHRQQGWTRCFQLLETIKYCRGDGFSIPDYMHNKNKNRETHLQVKCSLTLNGSK